MMIFTGAIVLLGGLAALVLNIIHGSSPLVLPLLFLVTVAGALLLVCGVVNRKRRKGDVYDMAGARYKIQRARDMADAGEISEEEYEGRVRELRRRFMPEEDEETEKGK